MTLFEVDIVVTVEESYTIEVEAEDQEAAMDIAEGEWESYTVGPDTRTVVDHQIEGVFPIG